MFRYFTFEYPIIFPFCCKAINAPKKVNTTRNTILRKIAVRSSLQYIKTIDIVFAALSLSLNIDFYAARSGHRYIIK